jgi:prepilin-type N-terminal cleavage/methylation domain-containing protein
MEDVIMENSNKPNGQSGFTLVEVLIATVVLAIGLLSIAQAFAQGMLILVNTPIQLAAKELAFEIIDDYVVLNDAGLLADDPEGVPEREITTRDGRVFLASANASRDPGTNVVTVDIVVSYCVSCGGRPPASPDDKNTRNYRVTAHIDP